MPPPKITGFSLKEISLHHKNWFFSGIEMPYVKKRFLRRRRKPL
jgi:hypothetical protein